MNPPGQSITEALHTITLYIYIYRDREEGDDALWSIEHRGLAYHYTIYIEEGDEPPSQSSIEALHTVTLYIYRERGRR